MALWARLRLRPRPRRQHKALADLVAASGAEIEWLTDEDDGLADSVFTHDPSLATEHGAIILSMGKALRRPEPGLHEKAYARMGVPILGRIEAPGTVEGGDCVWVDARTLAIGRGVRTNEAGIRQMAALLAPKGIEVLGYDLPLWHGEEACLHLMSVISPLADDLALVYSPLLPAAFYQLLKARGIQLVEGDAQEFHDSFGLSLNVLPTAPREGDRGRRLPEDRRGDGSRRLPGADIRGGCALHRLRRRPDLPDAPGVAGMTTLGEALIDLLEAHGVDTVFGIPGVHTVELYRGLAGSKIRHVTPRHEQGAGFMADGYARASGKPGVAFVITGPGLTNALTAMGQARADSVPMLVISGVNATDYARQGPWPSA